MTHWAWLRPSRILALGFAAVVTVACQGAPPATAPSDTAAPSSPSDTPTRSPTAAIAEKVDIGGRSLYLECRGSGSPTILFLHGAGGDRTHGHHLLATYADRHTVCVYDRANMGLSDPREGTQSGTEVVGDLSRLLEAADIPGPYLLVEARASLEGIPDAPVTYLRALQIPDLPPEAQEIWEAGLDELLARSSNGRVIDVDGPHALPPPPVHEAIDEMLDLLREP